MKLFSCSCGNPLFFDNIICVSCGKEVGWCPCCRSTVALLPVLEQAGQYHCGNADCNAPLQKCVNYADMNICTRCVEVAAATEPATLCDCCQFTDVIPDLSLEGNLRKWARLEAAKRRLFYILDLLQLPYGTAAQGFTPPLSFDFKGDELPDSGQWRSMDESEQVFTGHAAGKITINIKEADSVVREMQRQQLGEKRRTVIGHFRHEIGHYYWDFLVKGKLESEFVQLFGNHESPTYAEALAQHYAEGAPPNWPDSFVSAYATMHPWEDFAETFALYLDMVSTLDTAGYFRLLPVAVSLEDFDAMAAGFVHIGLMMNEMTREMGLQDYTPAVLVQPVREKLQFIHRLLIAAKKPPVPTIQTAAG